MHMRRPYEEVYLALEECSPGVKGALERLGGEVDRLAGRCRELEDALAFYAAPESWHERRTIGAAVSDADLDRGDKARAVLGGDQTVSDRRDSNEVESGRGS